MAFRKKFRLTEKQKMSVLRCTKEHLDNFISAEDMHSEGHAEYNVLRGLEPIIKCKNMIRFECGKQDSPAIISREELEYFISLLYFHRDELEKGTDANIDFNGKMVLVHQEELDKCDKMISRLVNQ